MLAQLAQLQLQRLSQWLFAAVAIGAIAVVIWMIFPRRRSDPLSQKRRPTVAQERAVERDMRNLLSELSEMARRVTEQLDDRAAHLEALIKEADHRIARLNEPPPPRVAPTRDDDGPIISIGDDPAPANPRHQQVYTLVDEGLNARQIAQRLNFPEGEVELIMALRPGPKSSV